MEVLVSITLLSIGIVSVVGGLRALNEGQARAFETEKVQRLAVRKLDELISTQQIGTTDTNGDFSDYGEPNYEWKATVQPSGIQSLDLITLTVDKSGGRSSDPGARIDTLYFEAPTTSGGATQ